MRARTPAQVATALGAAALVALSVAPAAAAPTVVERLVDDHAGTYSPDGRHIAFTRVHSTLRRGVDTHPVPKRSQIIVMRADGGGKRVLRHRGARFEESPSFSPDGRSIVFVRDGGIHVMRRDGGGARALTQGTREHACPRYSPNGLRITFWRASAAGGGHFVMKADGTKIRPIAVADRFAWGCPSWFPDGKRVVFARNYNLFVAEVNGRRTATRITDDRDGTFYRPSVSPDGRSIACDGTLQRSGDGIVVMRSDGAAPTRITTSSSEVRTDAGPSWSPDGEKVVFSGYRGRARGSGIYVVRVDGSGLRRLSNGAR